MSEPSSTSGGGGRSGPRARVVFNCHLSGYDRKHTDAGLQNYIPCNLGEIPDYYRRFIEPVDVMVIKTCPPHADGWFNFGPANLWHGAMAQRAKVVIVEIDPAMPYLHGIDQGLHVSEVDYLIDGAGLPLPELPNAPLTDADRAVGALIAAEIEDGSCLQIGIGAMPNAVCAVLRESGVKDLGDALAGLGTESDFGFHASGMPRAKESSLSIQLTEGRGLNKSPT